MLLTVAWLAIIAAKPAVAHELSEFLADIPGTFGKPTDEVVTVADGVPVRQRTTQSRENVATLMSHFATRFQQAGLFVAPPTKEVQMQSGDQVTGVDTENMLSFTVLLQPSVAGTTTIVLTSADLSHLMPVSRPNAIAPVFPGGKDVASATFEGMEVMTYSATGTPAQIKAFYRETLVKGGFVEGSDEMVFAKPGEELAITVAPGLSFRTVMVQRRSKASPRTQHP